MSEGDLLEWLSTRKRDELRHFEDVAMRVLGLASPTGRQSLDTIARRHLSDGDYAAFDEQLGPQARSVWALVTHPALFRDAEGFDRARRHRDHGKYYSAFEIDLDDVLPINASSIETDPLAERLQHELDLRNKVTVSTADLPPTDNHPASLLLIMRTGGQLASVYAHEDDGRRKSIHYRPSDEAILIYTPKSRQLEICSDYRQFRLTAAQTFAEVVLGQDLSKKPLTWKNYDLSRFQSSLSLPIPEIDGIEIGRACVTRCDVRLGNWSRVLTLTVSLDDDIEHVAETYLGHGNIFGRYKQFSRIVIGVSYRVAGDRKFRTLNLAVTEGNRSNATSKNDPLERVLARQLLEFWGIQEGFRRLERSEVRDWFSALLALLEHPEPEISGGAIEAIGLSIDRLLEAAIIERKSRQTVILIEDRPGEVEEAELQPSRDSSQAHLEGGFGEKGVDVPGTGYTLFKIDHDILLDTILAMVEPVLTKRARIEIGTSLLQIGHRQIDGRDRPVYIGFGLTQEKRHAATEIELRQRHTAGEGILISASPIEARVLGPNMVIRADRLVSKRGDLLDGDLLDQEFRANRTLMAGGQTIQMIRNSEDSGTVVIPGKTPLTLSGRTTSGFSRSL